MKRVELSVQARALIELWNDMTSQMIIRAEMIKAADLVLDYELKQNSDPHGGCDIYDIRHNHSWSAHAYDMLLNDGAFMVFQVPNTIRSKTYEEIISEHGNEDDETSIMECYWITALTDADPVKYMPLIRKIMDIEINGL